MGFTIWLLCGLCNWLGIVLNPQSLLCLSMAWDIPPTSALLPYHGVGDLSQWVPSLPAQNNHSRGSEKLKKLKHCTNTWAYPQTNQSVLCGWAWASVCFGNFLDNSDGLWGVSQADQSQAPLVIHGVCAKAGWELNYYLKTKGSHLVLAGQEGQSPVRLVPKSRFQGSV